MHFSITVRINFVRAEEVIVIIFCPAYKAVIPFLRNEAIKLKLGEKGGCRIEKVLVCGIEGAIR